MTTVADVLAYLQREGFSQDSIYEAARLLGDNPEVWSAIKRFAGRECRGAKILWDKGVITHNQQRQWRETAVTKRAPTNGKDAAQVVRSATGSAAGRAEVYAAAEPTVFPSPSPEVEEQRRIRIAGGTAGEAEHIYNIRSTGAVWSQAELVTAAAPTDRLQAVVDAVRFLMPAIRFDPDMEDDVASDMHDASGINLDTIRDIIAQIAECDRYEPPEQPPPGLPVDDSEDEEEAAPERRLRLTPLYYAPPQKPRRRHAANAPAVHDVAEKSIDMNNVAAQQEDVNPEENENPEDGLLRDPKTGKSPNIPDWIWETRPELTQIRDAAHYAGISPDAAFANLLTRYWVNESHEIRLDTGKGFTLDPINILSVVVSKSGMSKTKALKRGREWRPWFNPEDKYPDGVAITTGEGMIESFMESYKVYEKIEGSDKPHPVSKRRQSRWNVLFAIDEGSALFAQQERRGSIIAQIMKSMWSGEPLRSDTANAETRRCVENYVAAVLLNFTPNDAAKLLDLSDDGTPQRFFWFSASDPSAVRHPMLCMPPHLPSPKCKIITMEPAVQEWFGEMDFKIRSEQVILPILDSQRQKNLAFLAATLMAWRGGTTVHQDDLDITLGIWESCAGVRRAVEVRLETYNAIAAEKRANQMAHSAYIGRTYQKQMDKRIAEFAWKIADRVRNPLLNDGKWFAGAVQSKLFSGHKPNGRNDRKTFYEPATDYAVKQGWIAAVIEGDTTLWVPGPAKKLPCNPKRS